eukprot:COSAG06_NODE_4832_length_3922_cov_7.815067_2_plen_177_part_00
MLQSAHTTANCIIIAPKRLKLRLSGSARKSVSRHADVQISGRFGSNPAGLSRSVEKKGDQFRFKCRKMVNYYAIRSTVRSNDAPCPGALRPRASPPKGMVLVCQREVVKVFVGLHERLHQLQCRSDRNVLVHLRTVPFAACRCRHVITHTSSHAEQRKLLGVRPCRKVKRKVKRCP